MNMAFEVRTRFSIGFFVARALGSVPLALKASLGASKNTTSYEPMTCQKTSRHGVGLHTGFPDDLC